MASEYAFFVPGIPAPGGSKRHIGGGRIIEDCKRTKPWRNLVAAAARLAGCEPLSGPLMLWVMFHMPRPKGHLRKDGTLRPNAPKYPVVKPDTTKLLRALEDALTGIAWADDAQITDQHVYKVYACVNRCGANVIVKQMP